MPLAFPVSVYEIWLFFALSLIFFVQLGRAFMRRAPETVGKREPGSRAGMVLQSVGIAMAGFGTARPTLAPLSPTAIGGSLLVVLLMASAIGLFTASANALGRNWSIEARTRTDHQLIRHGPYARIRHPIYLGMLLFLLALATALGHWLQLIVAIPLFLVGTTIRTRLEDHLLEEQFGSDFRDYARNTPGLIPRFNGS